MTLKVEYLARRFTVILNTKSIQFKSRDMELSINSRACSQKTLKGFYKEFQQILNGPQSHDGETLTYSLKGKVRSESLLSRKGRYIISLPDEIKRIKIEEYLRCKKK